MANKSKIEWTDRTWSIMTGCTQVSEGCRFCYARRQARRLATIPGSGYEGDYAHPFDGMGFEVRLRPDRMDDPKRWTKPSKVFVCSMGDLFHDEVPFEFIGEAFYVMARTPQHKFQILTKRPKRMLEFFKWLGGTSGAGWVAMRKDCVFPLPNVWLGVSVENQATADERIPLLIECPAAVRFLSCEPLLGYVNLGFGGALPAKSRWRWMDNDVIHLVIVGGESGPNARPMHPEWATDLRDQCVGHDVPFMFKQFGEWQLGAEHSKPNANRMVLDDGRYCVTPAELGFSSADAKEWNALNPTMMAKVGKKQAGRELEGQVWDEYPAE